MEIIIWIFFGAIAGYIASVIMKSSHGWVVDVLLGIVGGAIGGFIMNAFGAPGVTGFNVYSLIVAIIGAVILIYLGRVLYH